MDRYLTGAIYTILLLCLIANSCCLGEKTEAAQSYKYVCSDGTIVSDSQECVIEEPTCSCNVPPIVCVCNQTTSGYASNQTPPTQDTQREPAQDIDPVDTDSVADNASIPAETVESVNACEELGCPKGSLFVGNNDTKKFHYCTCAQAEKISPRNRVCFSSAKYAESLGFIPCGFCKPSDVKSET